MHQGRLLDDWSPASNTPLRLGYFSFVDGRMKWVENLVVRSRFLSYCALQTEELRLGVL